MHVPAGHYFSYGMLTRVHLLDFEAHFKDVHKKHSPSDRTFFVHVTSVVVSARVFFFLRGVFGWELIAKLQDTKATTVTLTLVEDGILRRHLTKGQLL